MRTRVSNLTEITNNYIQKVYLWMFIGLIITSVTAFFISQDPDLYNVILGDDIVFYGILIAQFLAAISIVAFIKRIPDNLAEITFAVYCFLTGLTLSAIFLEFSISSIAYVVIITAAMFGFMSLYGYVTKTDLTSLGNIALMALFGIILALVVNLFIGNSVLDTILSIFGVIVFSALTAYDTQNIKNTIYDDGDLIKKEIPRCPQSLLGFRESLLGPDQIIGKKEGQLNNRIALLIFFSFVWVFETLTELFSESPNVSTANLVRAQRQPLFSSKY